MQSSSRSTYARRYLELAATLYAFVLPFEILPLVGGISIGFPFTLLLIFALANDMLAGSQPAGLSRPLKRAVVAFFAWSSLTWTWSVAPSVTLITCVSLGLHIVALFGLARVMPKHWFRLVVSYACGTWVLAVVALVAPAQIARDGRANVGGIDENVTAFVLALGLACALGTVGSSRKWRWLGVVVAVTVSGAILHVGSRTGAVALLLIGVFSFAYRLAQSPNRLIPNILLTLVACILAVLSYRWFAASGMVPERVMRLVDTSARVDDSGRAEIIGWFQYYRADWQMTGAGYGADAPFLASRLGIYKNAHSLFWATWVELGVVGLALLFLLGGLTLRQLYHSPARKVGTLLAAPILLFAVTLGGDKTAHFWFFIALAAAGASSARSESPEIRRGKERLAS